MENTPKQPETHGKSAAASSLEIGTKSNEADKLENTIGSGKDFDALVKTLKFAIERGDIDKENVHRLAHGLGVKPDTLASMVGVDNKENIEAEDQDESPENEVSPPDVTKNFKDFRSEIEAATSVTEQTASASAKAGQDARRLANLERRAGLIRGGDVSRTTRGAKDLLQGRRNKLAGDAGTTSQNTLAGILGTSQGRQLAARLRKRGEI